MATPFEINQANAAYGRQRLEVPGKDAPEGADAEGSPRLSGDRLSSRSEIGWLHLEDPNGFGWWLLVRVIVLAAAAFSLAAIARYST